jgi:aryl-alcohol dehydrogenase-like predicted oxidoreductase
MKLTKKIALGTVQFGLDYGISNSNGRTSDEEVIAILDLASQNGIKLLDTAQAYGISEELLGLYNNKRFDIVTKISPTDKYSVTPLINKSLERLNTQTLYGLLFHDAVSVLNHPTVFKELKVAQNKGIVQKVGFSVYSPEELENLINHIGKPDIIQIPFSHLDQRFEALASTLHSQGVEIHSRSTFLQGLFFMKPDELDIFFNPIKPYLAELHKRFTTFAQLISFLLNYVVSKPFIDKVIIGVNSAKQLETNLEALSAHYPPLSIAAPQVPYQILMPYLWVKN